MPGRLMRSLVAERPERPYGVRDRTGPQIPSRSPQSADVDWSQYGAGDLDFDIPEVEVDGETYQFPTQEAEQTRQQLAAELAQHALETAREELAAEYPDMPAKLLAMFRADSPEGLRATSVVP